MSEQIDYKAEVLKVYPNKNTISCDFYYDVKAKENLWHIDVIKDNRLKCIGKGLFKNKAWQLAYETIKKEKI